MKLFAAIMAGVLVASPAWADYFAGYSAQTASDQQTLDYASDLEGIGANLHSKLWVAPPHDPSVGLGFTAADFRSGVIQGIRDVYGVSGVKPTTIPVQFHYNDGGWLIHDIDTGSPWRVRMWYYTPATDPSTWKDPILIVSDVSISSMGGRWGGVLHGVRMPGENVGQFMAWDNHPVMMIALAGMEPYQFGGWYGMHPVYQFDSYANMRGTSAMSIWVHDAFVAATLLEQWHPGRNIGVIGASKSGIPAATTALLHDKVSRAYIASTFTKFEDTFGAGSEFSYGSGERLHFSRTALPLAMYQEQVRLSYSPLDDVAYRVEVNEQRLVNELNAIRAGWGEQAITQFSNAPSHYFDQADVQAFFN